MRAPIMPLLPMRLRLLPLALALMAGAPPNLKGVPVPDDNQPQILSAAIPPGPLHDAVIQTLIRPYAEATSTKLDTPSWDGTAEPLQKLLADHTADLVLLQGGLLNQLCHGATLQKLDWAALGRDRFAPNTTSDCGAGAYLTATLLAWDRDKLAGTPNWGDFWDVAKHPGRRGLRRGARGNLEIALLADGVSPNDIYRTLRSSDGLDRAFRKLDQLKPYILWWDQPAQPGQMLATAKVLLTSAPSFALAPSSALPPSSALAPPPRPVPANAAQGGAKLRIGMQWQGSIQDLMSWAVPSQARHQGAALATLTIATDPARLATLAHATGVGPVSKQAIAMLPGEIKAQNPGAPANQQGALTSDEGFWAENGDKLEARFTAWASK